VNGIERGDKFLIETQSIGLDKRKRVVRLTLNIDTYNVKACSVISSSGTSGTAEKVE